MRSISRSPCSSKIQSSTFVALAENRAKLTPSPVHVAPRGKGIPSRRRALRIICDVALLTLASLGGVSSAEHNEKFAAKFPCPDGC